MKKRKIVQILTVSCLLFAGFSSCKKFIQVDPPKTQAELSRIFSDDQTATAATVGLYYQMVAGSLSFCNGGITVYTGLYSDEIVNVSSNSTNDPFKNNALLTNHTTVRQTFWNNPYKNIYQANAVLEGLNGSTRLTSPLKAQLKGEMLYIRALQYFYLANIFGDVPLQTTTDFVVNSTMPRTGVLSVYNQIIDDLQQSRTLLNNSNLSLANTRVSKNAPAAFLARVYLYQKNWEAAEAMATEVINAGTYSLAPLSGVFTSTSKETIFQISKQTGNTAEGAVFVPSSGSVRPTYTVTNNLLQAFEPMDNRKSQWLKSNTVSGVPYYYPYKYKVKSNTTVTEFYVVQRLAELYLIRAEARAQLNKLTGAIDDLDLIRSRAGLLQALIRDVNPGISKEDLLNAILKERRVELFTEWGHRFLDLKRSGKADEILSTAKAPNWQPTDKFFPIPFAEIQTNPSLTQNDGYTN